MKDLPVIFLEEMKTLLKDDFAKFEKTYEENKYLALRANTLKISKEMLKEKLNFLKESVPWNDEGYYFDINERPAKSPLYHAGLYYIQEPSAMAVIGLFDIKPGMKVLDLCAAPGGKSINIGSKLKGEGLLVTNDISSTRAKALLKNIELFGISNALIINENQEKISRNFPDFFDRIVVDAPCSGEGMFRKDEDLIKSWEKTRCECPDIQIDLLEKSAKMLKSGGRIIYSTCTFSRSENEDIINLFLQKHSNFSLVNISKNYGLVGGFNMEASARLFPHNLKGEGHFLCIIEKEGKNIPLNKEPNNKKTSKNKSEGYISRKNLPKEYLDFEKENLNIVLEGDFKFENNRIYKEIFTDDLEKGFKILRNGIFVGEVKGKNFVPSQQFIMNLKSSDFKKVIDFENDSSEIIKYLKGETLNIHGHEDGFYGVSVCGFLVGYGKASNEKLKNGYNKNWRML